MKPKKSRNKTCQLSSLLPAGWTEKQCPTEKQYPVERCEIVFPPARSPAFVSITGWLCQGWNAIQHNLKGTIEQMTKLAIWLDRQVFHSPCPTVENEWQQQLKNLITTTEKNDRLGIWIKLHGLARQHFPGRWLEIQSDIFQHGPLSIDEYVLFIKSSEHLLNMGMPESIFRLMKFWLDQTKMNTQPDRFMRAITWTYTFKLSARLPRHSPVARFFLQYVEEVFFIQEEPEFFQVFSELLSLEQVDVDDLWWECIVEKIHVALRTRLRLETLPIRRKVIWETLITTLTPSMTPDFLRLLRECLQEMNRPPGSIGIDVICLTAIITCRMRQMECKTIQVTNQKQLSHIIPAITGLVMERLTQTLSTMDGYPMVESLIKLEPFLPPEYLARQYHVCRMKQDHLPPAFIEFGEFLFSRQKKN